MVKDLNSLIEDGIHAKSFSYSPYSKFRVGSAVRTSCGKVFKGCNVENASYGLTICAERTALVKAVSEGYKSFDAIVVATDVDKGFAYPCGPCRQFIAEFGECDVVVVNKEKQHEITKISTILPHPFIKPEYGIRYHTQLHHQGFGKNDAAIDDIAQQYGKLMM